MEKGDILYYARCLPTVGINELLELKIHTVKDTWFVGTEKISKQSFCFNMKDLGKCVFFSREEALECVNLTKRKVRKVTIEEYDEDEDE